MEEIIYGFSRQNAQNAVHVQYARLLLGEVPEEIATKYGFTSQRSLKKSWRRMPRGTVYICCIGKLSAPLRNMRRTKNGRRPANC